MDGFILVALCSHKKGAQEGKWLAEADSFGRTAGQGTEVTNDRGSVCF